MIGLAGSDLAVAVREAFGGLLDARHDVARVRELRTDALGFDPGMWRQFAADGWLGARVPEARGGAGLGATAVAAILDLIGTRLVPEPFIACGLLPSLLLADANADNGGGTLNDLISGERRFAVAWQEAAGEVAVARATSTSLVNGKVSGHKRFVVGGPGAEGLLVSAIDRSGGLRVVLVDPHHRGTTLRPIRQMDGSVAGDVEFDQAPVEATVCDAGMLGLALDEARVAVAVQLLGIAREALRITIDYAGTRRQFGRAIGSFQALQHRMVDFATRIRLSEVTCDAALAVLDEADRDSGSIARHAAAAKASAADTALLVTQGAIQIHGAIGYTDEATIGLYLAAALRLAPWLGAPAALRGRFLELGGMVDHG